MTTVEQTPDVSTRARRAFSKELFGGGGYRVEIGAAIKGAPMVNTAELAEKLGLSRQAVNQELRLLERAGLLTRTGSDSGRKVFFIPDKSLYWAFCAEAVEEAARRLTDARSI